MNDPTTADQDRLVKGLASSLAIYYAAEEAFVAEQTVANAALYIRAQDDYTNLRNAIRAMFHLGSSLQGVEQDQSTGG